MAEWSCTGGKTGWMKLFWWEKELVQVDWREKGLVWVPFLWKMIDWGWGKWLTEGPVGMFLMSTLEFSSPPCGARLVFISHSFSWFAWHGSYFAFLFSVSDWYHLNIGYDCVLNKFGVTVQSWRFLSSVKQLWTYMCESWQWCICWRAWCVNCAFQEWMNVCLAHDNNNECVLSS